MIIKRQIKDTLNALLLLIEFSPSGARGQSNLGLNASEVDADYLLFYATYVSYINHTLI